MIKAISITTDALNDAMDKNLLAGGSMLGSASIKTIGAITSFDCVTSSMPQSERKGDGTFKEKKDADGKTVYGNVTYPVVTGTVNGVVGSTVSLNAIRRGMGFSGALNSIQLQAIADKFETVQHVKCIVDERNRKSLVVISELEAKELEADETNTANDEQAPTATAALTRRRRNNA